jgi:hypothetical protein
MAVPLRFMTHFGDIGRGMGYTEHLDRVDTCGQPYLPPQLGVAKVTILAK